jgi:hypothetical protein
MPPGPGLRTLTVCFTGLAAALVRSLLLQVQVGSTAVAGALGGFALSFVFGPELVPQLAGALAGAVGGAIAGAILTGWVLTAGACTCPAGTSGFCIMLVLLVIPGVAAPIPLWPFAFPAGAACATLMPPGCP